MNRGVEFREAVAACPFCGEADFLEFTDEVMDQIQVLCPECGAFGPGGDTHEEATARWNNCFARVVAA